MAARSTGSHVVPCITTLLLLVSMCNCGQTPSQAARQDKDGGLLRVQPEEKPHQRKDAPDDSRDDKKTSSQQRESELEPLRNTDKDLALVESRAPLRDAASDVESELEESELTLANLLKLLDFISSAYPKDKHQ